MFHAAALRRHAAQLRTRTALRERLDTALQLTTSPVAEIRRTARETARRTALALALVDGFLFESGAELEALPPAHLQPATASTAAIADHVRSLLTR